MKKIIFYFLDVFDEKTKVIQGKLELYFKICIESLGFNGTSLKFDYSSEYVFNFFLTCLATTLWIHYILVEEIRLEKSLF